MPLSPNRWTETTPSQYRWEREALQWLRDHLPDEEGWHVWTNCEFLASSGAVYEIDALVLSPVGLFVVEIKSQIGRLRSEDGLWVFDHEGRRRTIENPVFLANRKAKALKGVLQAAAGAQHDAIPWVSPLVFLSGDGLVFELGESEVAHIALKDHKTPVEKGRVSGIVEALKTGQVIGVDRRLVTPLSRRQAPIINRAVAQVTRSVTARTKVGDYTLTKLLGEGVGYQDWLGTHQTLKNTHRRIRWYLVRDQADVDERARIQRAADREASILQGIKDPSILAFREQIGTDRGPALTFDYHPHAIQLDHWLAQREQSLDACAAYELLEKITQAIRQAHSHHLVHRALSPASILILSDPQNPGKVPNVALTNWQTALALAGDAKTTGTLHVEDLLDSRAAAYCAPEALKTPEQADGRADVFSLGCLAWLLFTGKAPAATHLELDQLLSSQGALRLAGAVDGSPPGLNELIWNATRADLKHRSQIDNFVDDLEDVLAGIIGDRPVNLAEDALAAHKGDQLQDEETRQLFTVESRLGSGASAIAYRISDPDGKVFVLKVARASEHDETLRAEFAALTKLRDRHIVQVHRLCTVDGHVAILMEDAGECLAARLRSDGPAHYDMLWRLGEDLLHAVDYLESVGVFHRDIKPDNCGIGEAKGTRKQTLVLFDFSLTNTAPTKINVGTRQYLDPFLPARTAPRFDTHAERYAAALTLFEMATARLPAWGDGLTDPRFDKNAVLNLASDRFPANIREQLDEFFRKALHRNPEARFDNARDMLRAWSTIFEEAAKTSTSHHTVLREDEITIDSPIVAIGLSPSSANVLDRLDVTTVLKLLKLRLGDLRGTKGITHKTKIEIRDAKRKWAARFPGIEEQDLPSMPAGGLTQWSTAASGPLGQFSIDHCIERLLDQDDDDSKAQLYKKALLGLGDVAAEPASIWPSQAAVGAQYKVSRQAVCLQWARICGRWKTKSGTVTGLRDAIVDILTLQSGVVTAVELADALLAQRGCRDQDIQTRRRKALAVIKAAVDVEMDFQGNRFVLFRGTHTPSIGLSSELGQYADQLGEIADSLVPQGQPPASPAKAIERLRAATMPGNAVIEDRRLLILAAAASGFASLSPNRLELYRKGMGAVDALRLASGALAGLDAIPVREMHQRVRDRYPDAELLPDRPLLDRYVDQAELGLTWDSAAIPDPTFPENTGAYTRRRSSIAPSGSGFSMLGNSRGHGTRLSRSEEQEAFEASAARLCSSRDSRGFLAIQCLDDWAVLGESALRAAYPDVMVIDIEAQLIASMRACAERKKIPWATITTADAAKPGSTDALNLRWVVHEAMKPLASQMLTSRTPLLLTNPGLIARHDLLTVLTDLRDAAGTLSGPPGVWVLIPVGSFSSHPTIDGVAVPIIGSHQTMKLHKAWIAQQTKASAA